MTRIVATTPGLFPLPDRAKDELSDLKGHQKGDLIDGDEDEEITAAYDTARETVIEQQGTAGLDRIVEGQLRWDDMLAHPLSVHENVETRGIVRYYDNNNFYREPVVTGPLTHSGDIAAELRNAANVIESEEALQAVVPGPYSLADLATDEQYGDEAEFLAGIAEFLEGEMEAFPATETLFVLEPSLVENPPANEEGEGTAVSEAIDTVASATDGDVVVQTYFGALSETTHAHLLDADIDAVGYDFVGDHEQTLYNINEYGTKDDIALGIVDGQNTRVESPGRLRERIEWVLEETPAATFETVYATPNTELFYLPVNRCTEKLTALSDAAAIEEVTV